MKQESLLGKGTMNTTPPIQRGQSAGNTVYDDAKQFQLDMMYQLVVQNGFLQRILHASFDHSNPVDEYSVIGAGTTQLTIQPDYTITEKYVSFSYSLPLGCTGATLTIGTDRIIPLYSGAAITVQSLQSVIGLGILADPNDKRILTLTGGPFTSNGWINLTGYTYTHGNESAL